MERLRLYLLGRFQALLNGTPISGFESAKSRALLAYLATENGRPHSREALAELLWPERPQGAALANLRHTLAGVRTAIEDQAAAQPCLLVTNAALQLDLSAGIYVDIAHFATLMAPGAAASAAACQEALALYGGPFLEGFTLDDSPEFEAWVLMQRERCAHWVAQALARLVRGCVEQENWAQAAQWTQRLLGLEPWNEDVHRQLIWLLAQTGARSAALHQYAVCVRVLADEFSVAPQQGTEDLARRIRSGVSDLGPYPGTEGGPFASSEAVRGSAHNLPVETTPLIGRTRELAEAAAALAEPHCRLLTVIGPGGIGKTRLATAIAQREAPRFPDGAWFADLVPANTAAVLPTVLLKRLAAPESGAADARRRLLAYLAPKQMLLVLDNFEHLLDGTDLITDMLAAAPGLKILVTSRARLNLRQEWLHPLEGLELPPLGTAARPVGAAELQSLPLDIPAAPAAPDLGAYDATRLFLQCVRRLQPDFAPNTDEVQLIVEICRRLDGVPLAIELAASWIRRLALADLAKEVADGLQQLEIPLRDMPARHRSMTAVFDQSWQLLSGRERAILRGLAVFRGGATRPAACEIAGATLADLGRLVDASWLRLGREGRYELHELVRQYCEARLAEEGAADEAEAVRLRHCTWYGKLLREQTQRMNYRQDLIANLMAEYGNLQAAWQWGVEHGQMEMARDMALSLYYIGDMLGWYHFAIQTYAPVIRALEAVIRAPATPATQRNGACLVLAWLEYAQGFQLFQLGLIEPARSAAGRCRTAAERLEEGDARAELLMLSDWLVTWTIFDSGDIETTRQRVAAFVSELEALPADFTLYGHETGRKFWLAHAYAGYARCDWYQGRYRAAEAGWQQALALREEMDEQRYYAFNLFEYARTCVTLGKYALALDLARRGLAYSESFGDQIGIATGRLALGAALAAQGQLAVAEAALQQSLAMGRHSGDRGLYVFAALYLGKAVLAGGRAAEAQAYFEEALDAATRNGSLPYLHLAAVLNGLGDAALARQDWDGAASLYRQVVDLAPHSAAWETQGALFGLAQIALAQGDLAAGYALCERVAHSETAAAATKAAAKHFLEVGGLPGGGGTSWKWALT